MTRSLLTLLLCGLLSAAACRQVGHDAPGTVNASAATATARHDVNVAGDGEEEIPLDKVPAAVKDAAIAAVPGLKLVEAEKEIENGTVVYNLEGTVNGVEYEIEVTADGKVTEIEKEDGDDADDDDDDDADDDDDDGMAQRR